ncbi:FRG domain-containing protein [Oceanospirillum sp.]|uniref:FRG domain-containing protein n=1 Tax=Oceanospirillum sp. TaxID=2021254 RepID=UPI003A8F1FB2
MKISKLSEYTSFVEELPKEFSLSRGQSGDYPLLPSALRKDRETGNRKFPKRAIRNFLTQFKINSYQYMPAPWDIKNDIEWMLYAQHYGLPTKLMDFTISHITSLLFAVEKAFQTDIEKDAVVYFLNPAELNQKNMEQASIVNVSGSDDVKAEGHDGPIVVQGRKVNSRINAQKGLFVLFQDDDEPLENTADESILKKLVIPGDATKDILSSLFSMGISFSHIYPELSSVSKDILLQQDIDDFLREEE